MTSLFEDPLVWVLLVVLIAAIFAVMRARRTNIQLRANNNKLHGDMASVRGQLAELQTTYSSVSSRHAADMEEVRKDAESATKATLKSAVGTLATLAEEQLALLDGLQQKYGDDNAVLADLMLVDHTGSQFSRRTKGISVLCGGWLGRRDRDASVYDVARSAQGRIRDFERVNVHSQASVAITSRAVEPVAMVLAGIIGAGQTIEQVARADAKAVETVRSQLTPRAQLSVWPDLLTDGKPPAGWPLDRPPYYLESSIPGVFVAGDVRSDSVKRVASAVGEGAMAVTLVHRYLADQ